MTIDGSTVYCTVVAQNYLPQALALHGSIQEHSPDIELVVMVVDGDRQDLGSEPANLRIVGLDFLNLEQREVLDLAAIYDVVEFSTSIKPLFFLELLNEYERVVYLDPDTFLIAPLDELPDVVDEHGIVFTPHFLRPIEPGSGIVSEVHSLTVGVHNLGFCAFNRTSRPFLKWWWSHLRRECLIYPLLSIFVDQKWTDIGSVLFGAHSWLHAGYNVGPWNLHEREIVSRDEGLVISSTGHPLRLVHFSGFDPNDPSAISVRLSISLKDADGVNEEFLILSRKYADAVLIARDRLGLIPVYKYGSDTNGRLISKRLRKTYRSELLEKNGIGLPSPFLVSERNDFNVWRRKAFVRSVKITFADVALAAKYALPDEFQFVKKRLPRLASNLRRKLLESSKVRR
ncbi:hypothetical protein ACS5PJ_17630 [Pseudarthrobacter sp. YS3]|uniref:hypothetical protein n=1 Tax=Pseudarthrobacter sp. YS3 TaxID=3453718 RepID=UPI003EEDC20B